MWDKLEAIKATLQTIADVKTVGIGLEQGISSKDTPAVRIILDQSKPIAQNAPTDTATIRVVVMVHTKTDIEQMYQDTISLSEKIREKLRGLDYLRTDFDGDSVKTFKTTLLTFRVKGVKGVIGCD